MEVWRGDWELLDAVNRKKNPCRSAKPITERFKLSLVVHDLQRDNVPGFQFEGFLRSKRPHFAICHPAFEDNSSIARDAQPNVLACQQHHLNCLIGNDTSKKRRYRRESLRGFIQGGFQGSWSWLGWLRKAVRSAGGL